MGEAGSPPEVPPRGWCRVLYARPHPLAPDPPPPPPCSQPRVPPSLPPPPRHLLGKCQSFLIRTRSLCISLLGLHRWSPLPNLRKDTQTLELRCPWLRELGRKRERESVCERGRRKRRKKEKKKGKNIKKRKKTRKGKQKANRPVKGCCERQWGPSGRPYGT